MAFINGFTYWNDGARKFLKHERSETHKEAVSACNRHSSKQVDEILDKNLTKLKMENRQMLCHVIEALRFLARQNLSIRGTTVQVCVALYSCGVFFKVNLKTPYGDILCMYYIIGIKVYF